jgi:DNA-binding NarL/FixJ family response regulator
MRILVISDKSMFGEGLCALLAQRSDFEVMGQVADVREGEVSAQIELLRPDILIVDCPDDEDPAPALVRCLKNGWVQKIITVNRRDNVICVFTSERRVVEDVGNLVEAITGDARL